MELAAVVFSRSMTSACQVKQHSCQAHYAAGSDRVRCRLGDVCRQAADCSSLAVGLEDWKPQGSVIPFQRRYARTVSTAKALCRHYMLDKGNLETATTGERISTFDLSNSGCIIARDEL